MTEPTVTQCDRDLAEALASCPYVPDIALAIARTRAEAEAAMLLAAAGRVRKFSTEAYHEGIESNGPAREDWLRRSTDAERYAKAVEALQSSDVAAALAKHEATIAAEAFQAGLREHGKHLGQFLNDMYATMIDPVDDHGMKVAELCETLLKAARDNRQALADSQVALARRDAETRRDEAKWWRYLAQMHDESYFAVEGDKRIAEHEKQRG